MNAWNAAWRSGALSEFAGQPWDLLVIGGGINGAGILREAARQGFKCLLLEQRDFAFGTSSRSSKMVHGGLRYIAKGDWRLTRDAVRERERLLKEAPGLIEPLPYLMPHYRFKIPGRFIFGALLSLYDLFAGQSRHSYKNPTQLALLAPGIKTENLSGGTCFFDAGVDDARLVLRVLDEARADGGQALNGVEVVELLRESDRVVGVKARDRESGEFFTLRSAMVAAATGAWADRLAGGKGEQHIRPLRGSHIVLPGWRLPVAYSFTCMHPDDGRPVFIFPWQGATVIGTTDLDHPDNLDNEARITQEELNYLLKLCAHQFPQAHIGETDVLSSFAGVRPVISSSAAGKRPSDESREHALWTEPGEVTLAGGKLTTFRLLAREVLSACAAQMGRELALTDAPVLSPAPALTCKQLSSEQNRTLAARHGRHFARLLQLIEELGSERIGSTDYLWAELALAAEQELVLHLDDLLLRRTRLGLLLSEGASAYLPRIRALCQLRLGWDDARWQDEQTRWQTLWRSYYSLPLGQEAA